LPARHFTSPWRRGRSTPGSETGCISRMASLPSRTY
jgi:hypothetical protein